MRNPYKRRDVFTCNYAGHAKFEKVVSAYHVLQAKKCYPQGCMMFKWSCTLMNKGKRCVRGFQHIGRLCEGCSYYRDERIHYQPTMRLSATEYTQFKEELDAFDEWLAQANHREHEISCRIDSIKPRFIKEISGRRGQIRLDGYLLIIEGGYIGSESFDDYFFLIITPQQQERFQFAPGDTIDARGRLAVDRGRILFPRIWQIEFTSRSGTPTWNNSRALVARESATWFAHQPNKCLHCREGALVDVIEHQTNHIRQRRQLICLQGIADWQLCYLTAIQKAEMEWEICPNDKHTISN